MVGLPKLVYIVHLLICLGSQVRSDGSNHRYNKGDVVPFFANLVGPFSNPRETYAYYDLPICSPDIVIEKKLNLGEMLNGDRLVSTPYKLEFLVDRDYELLCNKTLSKTDVSRFISALDKKYYTQFYYDDLPIWAFIGRLQKGFTDEKIKNKNKYFLYNHFDIEVLYNKDRVIEVAILKSQNPVTALIQDKEVDVDFTYSVKWKATQQPFDKRMEKYAGHFLVPHHMAVYHDSVTISSAAILILIICLLTFYLLVLRKDISKYSHDLEEELMAGNQHETGWKNY